jgi:hypothetical protein
MRFLLCVVDDVKGTVNFPLAVVAAIEGDL